MKKRLYLDYNATTPVLPEVAKTYTKALAKFGNPSSLHETGRLAKELLENSRDTIASAIGADTTQLIFNASGSEGNAQVVKSVGYEAVISGEKAHIITTAIEHASVRLAAKQMELFGVEVDVLPVNASGFINLDDLKKALKPHTKLVSVIHANNEVGTIQPIQDIVQVVKQHSQARVHSDAVQSLGKIPFNVSELGVDYASLSSHKIYAPKGVGALYVKDDKTLKPLVVGTSHERKLRAGTENVPGIAAFAKAVTLVDPIQTMAYTTPLLRHLRSGLESLGNVTIHTPVDQSLSTTLSAAFKGQDGHSLAIRLDLEGIDVSTGAACSSGSIEPSPILEAMGVSPEDNLSSLRFSVGIHTTKGDIDRVLDVLREVLS